MKTWVAACVVVAVSGAAVGARREAPPDAKWDEASEAEVTTRIGTFTAERVDDTFEHRVLLNGKEVIRQEGGGIGLTPVIKGKSQDFMLAFVSTGGSACLGHFVAWRVKTPLVLSEQFGTCSDAFRARVDGDRLIVRVPVYIPHPDLLPADELRKRERTEMVYTYVNGVLSETEERR